MGKWLRFQLQAPNEKGLRSSQALESLARPAGFEPTTPWFVARYSIQLSYGRKRAILTWPLAPILSSRSRCADNGITIEADHERPVASATVLPTRRRRPIGYHAGYRGVCMQQYRILTLNSIAAVGLRRFPDDRYVVGNDVDAPHAMLVRSRDLHGVAIPPTVRAIARAGAGTNNIPVSEMSMRGVPVFSTPGANANAVKELVLTALLLAARNVIPALRYVNQLDPQASDLEHAVEESKKQFAGVELPGRTLGVVGLGAIGSIVADTAIKLGMNVIGFDPDITVDAAWRLSSSVRKAHTIDELLRQADFVTLHVPLLDVTRHLIGERQLAMMKPGAALLNFARAEIVDDAAVVASLEGRRLAYYLCDFPRAALLGTSRVVALPHLGASPP